MGARFIWVSIYQTAIFLLYNDLPFHNMALCLDSHVVPKQKDSEPNKLTLFENYRPNFIMDIDCLNKASFLSQHPIQTLKRLKVWSLMKNFSK